MILFVYNILVSPSLLFCSHSGPFVFVIKETLLLCVFFLIQIYFVTPKLDASARVDSPSVKHAHGRKARLSVQHVTDSWHYKFLYLNDMEPCRSRKDFIRCIHEN